MRFSLRSTCLVLVTFFALIVCYFYYFGPTDKNSNDYDVQTSKLLKQNQKPNSFLRAGRTQNQRIDLKRAKIKLFLRKSIRLCCIMIHFGHYTRVSEAEAVCCVSRFQIGWWYSY